MLEKIINFCNWINEKLGDDDKEEFVKNFDHQYKKGETHGGVRSIEVTGPLTKNSKYIDTISTVNMSQTSEEAAKNLIWETITQHPHWDVTLIFYYNNGNTVRKEGEIFYKTKQPF